MWAVKGLDGYWQRMGVNVHVQLLAMPGCTTSLSLSMSNCIGNAIDNASTVIVNVLTVLSMLAAFACLIIR